MMRILATILLTLVPLPALSAPVDFHRDLAPILREYFAGCHNDVDL